MFIMDPEMIQQELERLERRLRRIESGGSFFIPAEIFGDLRYDPAAHYDERDDTLPGQGARNQRRSRTIEAVDEFNIEQIVGHFESGSKLRILDVGCAEGDRTMKYKEVLEERGYEIEIVGIDISPIKCDKARENLGAENVYKGSMTDLPFEDGRFDVVLNLYGGIAHLPRDNMRIAMREFQRVLGSNGALCVDLLGRDVVPAGEEVTQGELWGRGSKSAARNRNYMIYKSPGDPVGVVYMFDETEVRDLIMGSGLTVRDITPLQQEGAEGQYLTFSVKE